MSLRSPFWRLNPRLQRAAANNKAMRQGESDAVAVELLQEALVSTGIAPAIVPDGKYGPKTAGGVQTVEKRFNMDLDEGVAGRQTLGILDTLLQNGRLGADLARADVPLATRKVRAAIDALLSFQTARRIGARLDQLTVEALLTHFRLSVAASTTGVARLVTDADVNGILRRQRAAEPSRRAHAVSTGALTAFHRGGALPAGP
jgi:peptidoglycan hydrolase-like protein with peptidoglycan-binding domain